MAARLTDAHIRNTKPKNKPYKLTDGNGLVLLVKPNGKRAWRYRYRINGKENMYAIGNYPQIGVKEARVARDQARKLVEQGKHPARDRRADRQRVLLAAANTFEGVASEWIDQNRDRWSAGYLRQVQSVLAQDVYPRIGRIPISEVKPPDLLKILKSMAERDAKTVSILVRQWCSAIFRYAVATLRADVDPTSALRGAVRRNPVRHKQAMKVSEISELCRKLDEKAGTPQVRIALKLLLLTFVRPGELRQAQWAEFDLEAKEWRIPRERMKMREPHIVPLSNQAVGLLKELRSIEPARSHLFPNQREPSRVMSPTTLNRFLERIGYGGKFSAHGFRATASTILNEKGYKPDVIERQLAHRERNQVRASYNHATYLPERREMMQHWADFVSAQEDMKVRAGVHQSFGRPRTSGGR
jgi:integrase